MDKTDRILRRLKTVKYRRAVSGRRVPFWSLAIAGLAGGILGGVRSAEAQVTPTLTPTGSALSYVTAGAATLVDGGLTISGTAITTVTRAVVKIGNMQTGDVLSFTAADGVTGTFLGDSLVLTGNATAAVYQARLRTVTFTAGGGGNPSTAQRTISYRINVTATSPAGLGLIGTGVNAAGTALVATGTQEARWWVREMPSGAQVRPYRDKHTAWAWPDATAAQWSAWVVPVSGGATLANPATFHYKLPVNFTGFTPSSITITGQWASDNTSTSILVNGTTVAGQNGDIHTAATGKTFTLNSSNSTFLANGQDTITFAVLNEGGTPPAANPSGTQIRFSTVSATGSATGQRIVNVVAVSAGQSALGAPNPTSVVANGTSTSLLTMTVKNAAGTGITGLSQAAFSFSGLSSAQLSSFTEVGSGVYTIRVSNTVAQVVTIGVTVKGVSLGNFANVTFTVGPAAKLTFGVQPTNVTSGQSITPAVTVRIEDAQGNLTTSTSAVTLQLTTPGGATLSGTTSANAVGGVATFSGLSVNVANSYTLTAKSASLADGISSLFTVSPGAASKIGVSGPASVVAGATSGNITVTAYDANDNVTNVTANTVFALSSEESSTATFTPASGVFQIASGQSSATFTYRNTRVGDGTHSLTVTRQSGNTVGSANTTINVTAGSVTQLQLLMPGETATPGIGTGKTGSPSSQAAGASVSVTVNAVDAYWNRVTSATPTVAITSSDANATLPANAALTAGTGTFNLTFKTAGTQTVTATDQAGSSPLTPSVGSNTSVTAGAAVGFQVLMPGETAAPGTATGKTGTPATQTAGVPYELRVNLVDAYWNRVSQAAGAKLSSSDAAATLQSGTPLPDALLNIANGAGTTNLVFKTTGLQTITATDPLPTAFASNTGTLTLVVPGPVAQITFGVQPSDAVSGEAIAPAVEVRLEDTFGNLVDTATNAVFLQLGNAEGATLSGATSASAVNGIATFDDLSVDLAGTYQLNAYLFGGDPVGSGTFTISAGAPTQLAISTQPGTAAQSGVILTQQPVIQLRDAAGNAVAQAGVSIVASIATGTGTLGGTTTVTTDANGVATFTDLALAGLAGNYTLAFEAIGLSLTTSGTITLSAGLGNAGNTSASVPNGTAGEPTTVTVTVLDGAGNPVTGWADSLAVVISGANDTTVIVTDNGDGTYTAIYTPLVSGADSVAITLANVAISGSPFESVVSTSSAFALTIGTEPSAAAQSGITLAQQPVIQVRDSLGNAVSQAGIEVTAAIATGSGELGGTVTANTDANGVATFTNLGIAGPTGSYTLAFSATDLVPDTSATIVLSAGLANADSTTAVVPNGTAGAPTTITVTVRDGAGNSVTGWADSLAVTISGANDTTVTVTDNGDGTYTAIYTPLVSGADSVAITLAGVAISGSPFESIVSASSAFALTIGTEPSVATQSGIPLAQQPVIQARDSLGNAVPQAGIEVTAAIATGTGTLGGTTTVTTDANGVATFTDLALAGSAGNYTLAFSATGLVPDTSIAIELSAGLGDAGNTSANVPNGTAGAPTTVTVTVLDGAGNPVTGWADSLAITISGANDTTVTVTDNGDGTYTAIYTPLVSGADTVAITLVSAAISGSPFESIVSAATASVLSITTEPSSAAQSGIVLGQQPTIQLRDSLGNAVPQAGLEVTAALLPGSSTLMGTTTATTDANGVATFTDLAIAGATGTYTLAFSATGLVPDTSSSITVSAGIATADSTTAVVPNGTAGIPTTITVTVRDGANNVVTGWADSLAITITGANDTTVTVTDNGDGTYTAIYTPLVSGADTVAITLASAGISGSPFESVVSAAAASAVTISTEPSASTQSGITLAQQPVIQIRDSLGNAVPQSGIEVTAAIVTGAGTVSGTTTVTTDANGVAAFTDLSLAGLAGNYTLAFSATGLAADTSTVITLIAGIATADSTTAVVPNGTAGAPTTITVTIRDGAGNSVTGWADSLAVVISGANDTTVTVTDNGDGTYTASYTPLVSGADTVAITLAGATISGSPFESVVSASTASVLSVTTEPSSTAQSGIVLAQQPVIQVRDSFGNAAPQAGLEVTAAIATGTGTLSGTTMVTTDANGVATFTDLSLAGSTGSYTLVFSATSLVPDTSATIVLSAGLATADSTTAVVPSGTAGAPTTITVTVRDGAGNSVSGWADSLAVTISGANDTTVTVTDNGDGTYTAIYTPRVSGADSVAITLANVAISGSPFESVVSASPAFALTIDTEPSAAAQSGITLAQQPVIQVRDSLGNAVPQAGIEVTAAIVTGNGVLDGTVTTNTDANGVATFTDLSITGSIGSYTLAFSAVALMPDTSVTVMLSAGIANADSTTAVVPNGTAGAPTTITVTVRDGASNVVTGWADSLAIAITGANDTTVTVTDNGDGTYTAIYTPLVSGEDTVAITLGGTAINGSSFESVVSAASASVLAIATQPGSAAQSGIVFGQQPIIQLRDSFGNTVAQAGIEVTAAMATGTGTLGGTTTVTTDANGVATFTDLALAGSAGNYTLAFSATGLVPDTSIAIELSAGLGDAGNTSASVPNGTAGEPTTVTVTVLDGAGNPVTGWADSLAVVISGANDTTVTVTDNGDGTYTAIYTPRMSGADTVAITLVGATISGSPFESVVSAAAASAVTISTEPSASTQSGITLAQQPVIQIRDSLGNAVPQAGIEVTAAIATGAGTVSGTTTVTTDAGGVATFTDLAIAGATGTYTLAFSATGLVPDTSTTITVSAGLATADSTTAVVPNGTAGVSTTITVTVRDGAGNSVTGWADSLAITTTGANDTTVTVTDNGDGTYTAIYTPLVSGTDTVAITLTGAPISSSPFESVVSASVASVLSITTEPSGTAQSGIVLGQQPVIQLRDSLGNVVSQAGLEVTAAIASGNGTLNGTPTTITNANGVATFTDLSIVGTAGTYTLTFSAAGLVPDTSATIVLSAGIANADSTTAVVPNGTAGALTTITVTVLDGAGNPVTGWADSLAITISGANDTTVTVTDNNDGTYTAIYTPQVSGVDTVAITLVGTTISGSPFESVVSASTASVLSITTEPSSTAQSGIVLAQQPVVQVRDSLGNAVSQAGLEITAVLLSGSGVLQGTTTATTDADGIATFTDLAITGSAGTYTIAFSASGLATDTSTVITLAAGIATADSTTAVVPNGTAGVPTTITVTVRDGAGNSVTGWADSLTVVIAGANDTTVFVTDNGDGTYTASYTPLVSGEDTVAITLGGTAINGSPFESVVSAAVASALTINTEPSNTAQSGIVLAQQPAIQVRDSLGNTVPQAGIEITAAIATGTGTLSGTTTVTTDANGVANFTDLALTGAAGNYTLTFSATGLSSDTSTAIVVSAGLANADSTTAVVPGGTAGIPTTITVTVRDGAGNSVTGWADSLAVAIAGANDTTVTVTDNGDGTYTATYTPLVSGADTVTITLAGAPISGSPFESVVSASVASALSIATEPSSAAQSGIALAQQPVIQVRDSLGNAVPQAGLEISAALLSGSGTLQGITTATTDANGFATFADLAIAGAAGNYTLVFSAAGLVPDTSATITVSAGLATASSTTAVVPNGAAGTPTTIIVTVRDEANNIVTGWADSLAITITGANDTTVTVTDNGDGTYTAIYTPLVSGADTVAITLAGAPISNSPFESVVSAATASAITINTEPSSIAQSGMVFSQQPVIQLRDSLGNAVPQSGVAITASVASGNGALGGTTTVNTDANGVATFTDLVIAGTAENYTLAFSSTGLVPDTSTTITVSAGLATADSTTAVVPSGTAGVPTTITVTVRDGAGNPVAGWADSLAIAITGANDTTVNVTDNNDGTYTTNYTPRVSGTDTITITLAGASISNSPFESVVSAAAASIVALSTEPGSAAQSGITFAQQPIVQIHDSLGNAVSQAGLAITAAIASGSGTLHGTTTVNTDADGIAIFTDLSIVGAAGTYTLAFSATGLAPDTSVTITVGAGIATADSTTAVVPNGTAGVPTTITVTVRDGANNPISGWADSLAVTITGANDTTVTVTDNGDGTYTAMYTPLVSGADTVTITLAGTPINGSPFESNIGTSAASVLTITAQPSGAVQSGIVFGQQPVVQVRDSLGNVVSQAGISVTAAIASGSGILNGTTVATTDANGVATFTDLALAGATGSYTLAFSATGLSPDTSTTIVVSAGLANADSTTAVVPTGIAGTPTMITVTVLDGAGNPVAGWADSLAIAITGANDTTITVTDNGDGTYSATYIPRVSGTDTVAITLAGNAIAGSPFESAVGTAAAFAVTLGTQPSAATQSGVALVQQPVVQLRDSLGNAVVQAGVAITATIASGAGTLQGNTTVNTDATGVAAFTDLSIVGATGNYTLAFSAAGLVPDTSATITVSAGLATADSTTAVVPGGMAGVPTTITVTVRDGANNIVTGWADSLAVAITGANDTTVTVTDNGDGTYTASYTPLVSGADTVAITLAGAPISGSPFESIVSAASASAVTISTQPSAVAQNGIVLTQQPVLQLRDGLGNVVSQAGVEVTAMIATGSGTLSGTATMNTDANGVATFTNLAIVGTTGNYTLAFSAAGVAPDTSTTITVSAGIATADNTTAVVPNGTAGIPTTITVTVRDGANNVVTGWADSLAVAITGANDTTVTVTDNGDGTYTATYTPLVNGADTVAITLAGNAIPDSPFESEVSASAASVLAIRTEPSTAAQNGIALAQQPVIQLRDSLGNTVSQSGIAITASVASGSGTLSGTTTVNTDANGAATFTDLSLSGVAGTYTLAFSATGLVPDTSTTITLSAGIATADSTTAVVPSGTAGIPTTITVTVRDGAGNPVAGWADSLAITITGANDTTVTVTDNGDGTYSAQYIPLVSGTDAIAVTLAGAPISGSPFESAVGASAAAVLAITTQPSAIAESGLVLVQQPAVQVRDSLGNAVTQVGIPVTATIASGDGALNGTTTVNTDASGIATFTNLGITGVVGSYTLAFSAPSVLPDTSTAITLNAGVADAGNSSATVPNGTAGMPTTITVTVRDATGNPITGWADSLALVVSGSNDTTITVTDNGDGTYTAIYAPRVNGTDAIAITLAGVPISGSPFASVVSTSATAVLVIHTEPGSAASSGVVFAEQPAVQLRDGLGNNVSQAGVSVTATLASGSGTLHGTTTVTTDATGVATFTDLSILGATGTYTLAFSATGLTPDTSGTITLQAGIGQASQSTASVPTGTAGVPTTITITVRDDANNPVTGWADSLAITITGANDTTITVTDNGDGTYTALYTPLVSGSDTIAITLAGHPIAGSPFVSNVNTSAATVLAISTLPSTAAQSGIALAQQPAIQVYDSFGNPVAQAGIAVTAAIANGSGTLSGTTTVNTNAAGLATFTNLALTGAPGSFTLAFTATGFIPDTSATITLTAGAADPGNTTATVPPGTAGTPTTVLITVQDASGTPLAGWADSLAITIRGANDTTLTVTDHGDGTYSATYLPIGTGMDTLAITLTGIAISGSPYLSPVTSAAAATLMLTTQPSPSAQSGGPFAQQPVVQLQDSLGNAVAQAGVQITASIATGGGVLGGTTVATTDALGQATFTNLQITGATGPRTLAFSAPGMTVVTSQPVAITTGLVDPGNTTANVPAGLTGQPTIITIVARDASGNTIDAGGASVIADITGANTATPSVTDNGDGTYTVTYTPSAAGQDSIALTINGVPIAGSPFVSQVELDANPPGAPANLITVAGDQQVTLSWSAPGNNGGAPITDYVIQYSVNGGVNWTTFPHAASTNVSVTVNGLLNNRPYIFRVAAVNAAGTGTFSMPSAQVIPAEPVPMPTGDLPEPEPGESYVMVDGSQQPVVLEVVGDTILQLRGSDFTIALASISTEGSPAPISSVSTILYLKQGSFVRVSGHGFAPGTVVSVWIFSTPVLLGHVTVNNDGTFSGLLPLPSNIVVGHHTIQANGLDATLTERSASVGVMVVEPETSIGTAELAFEIIASDTTPTVGDTITITVKVRNVGTGPATDLVITRELADKRLDRKSVIVSQGTIDTVTNEWRIGRLEAGATATMTIRAVVVIPQEDNEGAGP